MLPSRPAFAAILANRFFQSAQDDFRTGFFIAGQFLNQGLDVIRYLQRGRAAAGNDSFFNSSARCRKGVFDSQFDFLHFRFRRCADADNCYAASQLRKAFLKLFFIIIGGRFFDLGFDGFDASFDVFLLPMPSTIVVLSLSTLTCFARPSISIVASFEIKANFFRNHCTARKRSNILQHCFSSVAKARSFYRNAVEYAAQLIDYESSESFAFNVFSNNEQLFALLNNLFQNQGGDPECWKSFCP